MALQFARWETVIPKRSVVVTTRQHVLERLSQEQATLRRDFRVTSLALFGSLARDEATDKSDIDLLVTFKRPAGYFALIALQQYLESVLGRNVDIVTPGGLKSGMRERVLQEAIDVK
jgi:predicted nucleotidyltransferase